MSAMSNAKAHEPEACGILQEAVTGLVSSLAKPNSTNKKQVNSETNHEFSMVSGIVKNYIYITNYLLLIYHTIRIHRPCSSWYQIRDPAAETSPVPKVRGSRVDFLQSFLDLALEPPSGTQRASPLDYIKYQPNKPTVNNHPITY